MEATMNPPAQPQPVEEATLKQIEPCAGIMPRIGDQVYFYTEKLPDGSFDTYSATLIRFGRTTGKWTLNIQRIGLVLPQKDISFSDSPASYTWGWMPPRQVVPAPKKEEKAKG